MVFNVEKLFSKYSNSISILHNRKLAVSDFSEMPKELAMQYVNDNVPASHQEELNSIINGSKNVFYYNRLNVPKEIRGLGIGKLLLKETLEYCRNHNAVLINTVNNYSDMSDKELIKFYEAGGMKLLNKSGFLVFHKNYNPEPVVSKKRKII